MRNMVVGRKFIFVQEEIKSLLSIIMGVIAEEAQEIQNLEYFLEKATSPEDTLQIQELQKSMQEIEKQAQEYHESIGIATKSKDKNKNIPHVSESALGEMQTTKDIPENEIEGKEPKGFDIEL